MLSFKQYLNLLEVNIGRFTKNIEGFDETNPEHQDLHAAYELTKTAPDGSPKKSPDQIKTLDNLRALVKPAYDKLQKEKETKSAAKTQTQRALESGTTNVIHHDHKTGLRITAVSNQEDATNNDPKNPGRIPNSLCIGDPDWKEKFGTDMIRRYDPTGDHTFKFEFPHEEDPDHRMIVSGNATSEDDELNKSRGNFQYATNNTTVPMHHWHNLIKKYGLDKIKHLKGEVPGIPLTDEEKEQYAKELEHNMENGTASQKDFIHAISNDYIKKEHIKSLVDDKNTNAKVLESIAGNTLESDHNLHEKILNHPNVDSKSLSTLSRYDNLHEKLLNHPKANSETLAAIGKRFSDPKFEEKILNHPKANDETLAAIANRPENIYNDKKIKLLEKYKHKVGHITLNQMTNLVSSDELNNKILDEFNDKLTPSVLANLSENSNNLEVHKKILKHPKTDNDSLLWMVHRHNYKLQHEVLNHPKVEDSSLSGIAQTNPSLHNSILNKCKNKIGEDTIHNLIDNGNSDIQKRLLKEHTDKLNTDNLDDIAKKHDYDPELHELIKNHPKASKKTKDYLNDTKKKLKLASDENTDNDTLKHLVYTSNEPKVHLAIANHKNSHEDTLEHLADISDDPKVKLAIANNKKTDMLTLGYMMISAKHTDNKELQELIKNHPNYKG